MSGTARVALLQLPAFDIADAEESLSHTLARIDEAARDRPDIIVMPEGTYPAYFLGRYLDESDVRASGEVRALLAAKAREHGVYVAAGMAYETSGDGFANAAVLFNREGEVTGRYDKSFLWHFDNRWFTAGNAYPAFQTDFGRVGMLVCADSRIPEIARALALNGAQIILDLTAWVSGARRPSELTSPQPEYIMPVRAAENGVWIAAADKVGAEAQSIVYCGHSCVIDPHGSVVAELSPDEEGTLVYDVPLGDAQPPVTRRPDLYETLVHPTESLPAGRALNEPATNDVHQVAAVQMAMPATGSEFVDAARRHVVRLALHDAELVVFPATPTRLRGAYPHDETLDGMSTIARDTGLRITFTVSEGAGGSGPRVMYLVGPRGVVCAHRQTHKPPGPRFETMPMGDDVCPVVDTPIGKAGLLLAAEGFVPEVARSLMLRGAEILIWAGDDPPRAMGSFARCRADENRCYVVCAGAPTANAATMIVEPTGAAVAVALEGRELAVSGAINRALAHIKERAPGTDVLRNRQPATYGVLTRAQPVPEPVI